MRKLLVTGICILLTACIKPIAPSQYQLEPEEVLRKAAAATKSLDSAQYTANADFDAQKSKSWSATGTARMDGILRGAGDQMRMQMDIVTELNTRRERTSVTGTLEVVVMSEDEVYMNLHSLMSQPSSDLFKPEVIGLIASRWWLLPSDAPPSATATVAPDPALLKAQSEVVVVKKDRGVTEVHGFPSYHYDVVIDKEKLISYLKTVSESKGQILDLENIAVELEQVEASGQLWIDAETYHVRKISWVVQSFPIGDSTVASVSFSVTFRNINDAPTIEPPEGAQRFTPEVFFTLPSDGYFQDLPSMQTKDPYAETIDSLLEQLNAPYQ